MSSSCAGSRLVRCRVKHVASCFFGCKLSDPSMAEEDYSEFPRESRSSSTDMGSIKGEVRGTSGGGVCGGEEDSRTWPRFSEEDYIVFCFREDGAIQMINEHRSSSSGGPSHTASSSDASVKRSVHSVGMLNDADRKDEQTTEEEIPILAAKCEYECACKDESGMEMKKSRPNEWKMESFESWDSNQSDTTSTSSFAFPKLGREWIGSPVHMPKSEKQHSLLLHCCRF